MKIRLTLMLVLGGIAIGAASTAIDAKSSAITNVTVFVDRAEVTRAVTLASDVLAKPGQQDIVIKGLPAALDPDSLRVRVIDDRVKLLELSHEKRWQSTADAEATADDGSAKAKREALEAKIKALEARVTEDKQALHRLATQLELVEAYGRSVTGGGSEGAGAGGGGAAAADVESVGKVLELYATRAAAIDGQRNELERQKGEKEGALAALRRQLQALLGGPARAHRRRGGDTRACHDVTLSLAVSAADDGAHGGDGPTLQLVYMVRGASWTPSYDIRVAEDTDDGLTLTYFGEIVQRTGEDWTDARLLLSTATPSVGGRPPSIGTKIARFRPRPIHYQSRMAKRKGGSSGYRMARQEVVQQANVPLMAASMGARGGGGEAFMAQTNFMEEADDDILLGDAPSFEGVSDAATAVSRGATSTSFAIERATTIASDNKPHKVTVAVINMATSSSYYAARQDSAEHFFRSSGAAWLAHSYGPDAHFLRSALQFLDRSLRSSPRHIFPLGPPTRAGRAATRCSRATARPSSSARNSSARPSWTPRTRASRSRCSWASTRR